jgi:hypothetical protein
MKPRPRLFILLGLVFVSRVLLLCLISAIDGPSGFMSPDSEHYVELSRSLLHGSFSETKSFPIPGAPQVSRTPGYPLILLPAVGLHSTILAVLENCLFATLLAWAVWKITLDLNLGPRTATWAVCLYCLEPVGFVYCGKILSETAFAALFLLAIWLIVLSLRKPSYTTLAFAAALLGCATYVRPISIYLGVWLVPVFALFPRDSDWKHRISRAIVFPVILGLTLTPWILRNTAVAGYQAFSSSAVVNLYFYDGAAVLAKLKHHTFEQMQADMGYNNRQKYVEVHPEQQTWSQSEIFNFWDSEAKNIAAAHWRSYTALHARGCVLMIVSPGVSELLIDLGLYPTRDSQISNKLSEGILPALRWIFMQYPVAAVAIPLMVMQLFLYYVFALVGLRRLPLEIRILFVSLSLYFVLVSGVAGTARFRVPIMPLVCISAAAAIANWKRKETKEAPAGGSPGNNKAVLPALHGATL